MTTRGAVVLDLRMNGTEAATARLRDMGQVGARSFMAVTGEAQDYERATERAVAATERLKRAQSAGGMGADRTRLIFNEALLKSERERTGAERPIQRTGAAAQAATEKLREFANQGSPALAVLARMGPLGLAVGVGLSAAAAGIALAARTAREAARDFSAIADRADELRVSFETLQAFEGAAILRGIDPGRVAGLISGFADVARAARDSGSETARVLQTLDPQLARTLANTTSLEQGLNATFEALGRIEDPSTRAAVASALFGDAQAALVLRIAETEGGLDGMARAARDAGLILDRDMIDKARELDAQVESLSRAIDLELKQAFIELGPVLVDTLRLVLDVIRNAGIALQLLGSVQRPFGGPGRQGQIGQSERPILGKGEDRPEPGQGLDDRPTYGDLLRRTVPPAPPPAASRGAAGGRAGSNSRASSARAGQALLERLEADVRQGEQRGASQSGDPREALRLERVAALARIRAAEAELEAARSTMSPEQRQRAEQAIAALRFRVLSDEAAGQRAIDQTARQEIEARRRDLDAMMAEDLAAAGDRLALVRSELGDRLAAIAAERSLILTRRDLSAADRQALLELVAAQEAAAVRSAGRLEAAIQASEGAQSRTIELEAARSRGDRRAVADLEVRAARERFNLEVEAQRMRRAALIAEAERNGDAAGAERLRDIDRERNISEEQAFKAIEDRIRDQSIEPWQSYGQRAADAWKDVVFGRADAGEFAERIADDFLSTLYDELVGNPLRLAIQTLIRELFYPDETQAQGEGGSGWVQSIFRNVVGRPSRSAGVPGLPGGGFGDGVPQGGKGAGLAGSASPSLTSAVGASMASAAAPKSGWAPVRLVVNNQVSGAEVSGRERTNAVGEREIQLMIRGEVRRAVASGGLDGPMQSRFGLRPAAVGR